MNQDDIIFLKDGQSLHSLPRTEYESEALLQSLLASHPALLSGGQLRPEAPIRWLLIRQEASIPDQAEGAGRWAVDHLLLDQDARPTFVEVKRSADTRIRREVVGQMLDYAANATHYWPAGRIRQLALERLGSEEALEAALRELLPSEEGDAYWERVSENLRLGRIRLLFVADAIPPELRRIIEFLNAQMPAVEVLGVEISQYTDGNRRIFVPRVVGKTEQAQQQKGGLSQKRTTQREFLEACPELTRPFFEALLQGAVERRLNVLWGTRGFSVRAASQEKSCSLFYGYPPGAMGRKNSFIQGYLGHISEASLRDQYRAALQASAPFAPEGQHTLHLDLTQETLAKAKESLSVLWRIAEQLQA